jgi:hypothetical protein
MSYRIAGIDVHKKMLAVVVADVESEGEYQFLATSHKGPTCVRVERPGPGLELGTRFIL